MISVLMLDSASEEGFQDYVVTTTATGPALYAFVLVYSGLSFLLITPLVIWGDKYEKQRRKTSAERIIEECVVVLPNNNSSHPPQIEESNNPHVQAPIATQEAASSPQLPPSPNIMEQQQQLDVEVPSQPRNVKKESTPSGVGAIFRGVDRIVGASYPDNTPEFRSAISGSINRFAQNSVPAVAATEISNAGRSSAIHSAATTSRLYAMRNNNNQRMSEGQAQYRHHVGIWDVGGRRWKDRRPFGRVDVMRRAIASEARSNNAMESRSMASPGWSPHSTSGLQQLQPVATAAARNASDLASSVLDELSSHDGGGGDSKTVHSRSLKNRRHTSCRRSRVGSTSTVSVRSFLPPLNPDALSPNDAADAHDPGRVLLFEDSGSVEIAVCCGPRALWSQRSVSEAWENLLELATPNTEMRRIFALSVPLTFGATTEPLCRVVMTAFIANSIGTDAMVAFVLVFLLVRLSTEELAGAVVDAQSTLILDALCSGAPQEQANYLAGQYVQLSLLLQLLMTIPIFIVWAIYMEDVILWLVQSASIAAGAKEYTRVIIYRFLVQIISRTLAIVLQESGDEHFDSTVGVCENIITLVTVACVVTLVDEVRLATVGWIQVIIGVGAAITKVAWSVYKGWFQPYSIGIFGNVALSVGCMLLRVNRIASQNLVLTALPLLIGTFLEFGEFELLTLCTRHLGSVEVATFALLTILWEVFEASTEGIGEAASIRVAYHLSEGKPATARISSYKVLFLSTVESLIVTSAIFLAGKNLAVTITRDFALQHMLNSALTFLGLANITMTFARVCWSLIGAQGRFRVATMVMLLSRWLVALPVAFTFIFGFSLNLDAVVGAVSVGYATACCALGYILIRSDWQRLSRLIQELNSPPLDAFDDFDEESDEEESDEDESEDRGGE